MHFVIKSTSYRVNFHVDCIVESKYKVHILITAMSRQRRHHNFLKTYFQDQWTKTTKATLWCQFLLIVPSVLSDVYLHKIVHRTFLCAIAIFCLFIYIKLFYVVFQRQIETVWHKGVHISNLQLPIDHST